MHTDRAVALLKMQNKRETSSDKIIYNGQDLNFFITQKIENITRIISEKEKISFESAYGNFLSSGIHKSLQNTASMLWTENAEFIVDEYYREKRA